MFRSIDRECVRSAFRDIATSINTYSSVNSVSLSLVADPLVVETCQFLEPVSSALTK